MEASGETSQMGFCPASSTHAFGPTSATSTMTQRARASSTTRTRCPQEKRCAFAAYHQLPSASIAPGHDTGCSSPGPPKVVRS